MNVLVDGKHMKKWHVDEITQVFNEFEEDIIEYIQREKPKDVDSYENLMLKTCGKVFVTIREIIILCSYGYSDGALALARNIYEQMIILAFFESKRGSPAFDSYINDYFLDYEVQRLRALRHYHDLRGETKETELISAELREIKKNIGKDIKGEYWWAEASNFAKIVELVIANQQDTVEKHFICELHLIYKRACVALHASSMGNSIRVGKDNQSHVIDTTPDYDGLAVPLFFTVASFTFVVGSACELLGIDYSKYKNRLNNICITLQNSEHS